MFRGTLARMRAPVIIVAVLGAAPAAAHFRLEAPASLGNQNALGNPQKTEPCGQDDPSPVFTPTGAVNTAVTGSMVTITINETVFHPGHYRVAIAADMASLPANPPVTPGTTPCGSTVIDPAPAFPILADGVLPHTMRFAQPMQSFDVQLPAGFTCTNCVMQVTQFMSSHGAPCFYHHCATFTIADNPPPAIDAGTTPGGDAGGPGEPQPGGCCSGSRGGGTALLGVLVFALVARRRRR
jgi:hypothetical protein